MNTPRQDYARLRSILEIPLTGDRYWPRIADSGADGIMLDLEDSAKPDQKADARGRAIQVCSDPAITAGKFIFVRVNNLDTPWGEEDLQALASCPPEIMICYPKTESRNELDRAVKILSRHGPARKFYIMIESYIGIKRLDDILTHPHVVGVHFGYTDYAMDVGCRLFNNNGDDFFNHAMLGARALVAAAAAGHGRFSTGGTLIPDYRSDDKVANFVRAFRDDGYSACIALAPRHLDIIHDNIRSGESAYADALTTMETVDDMPGKVPFVERKVAELTIRQYRGY